MKKVVTGLLLWKARDGTTLNADFDATERVDVRLTGRRRADFDATDRAEVSSNGRLRAKAILGCGG